MVVTICTGCAGRAYEIKLKGEGIRPIIATTKATSFAGCSWDEGGGENTGYYQVTAQIVGANVAIVEELVVSLHGTNSQSVVTTNIPISSLPHTFTLSQTVPTLGKNPSEHARVTVLKVKPRIMDKDLPEKSIKVGDDSAAARRKIMAAGGKEVFTTETPISTFPVPVVDAKGQTNMVSRTVPVPLYFEMKDGRRITITLSEVPSFEKGGCLVMMPVATKVTGVTVEPPLETND